MLGTPIHDWVVFAVTAAAALVIDLGVFHRKNHVIRLKEALLESAAWILVSLIFNLWLYFSQGPQVGMEFLTGYLVEKSLSVDNIFVFLLIFQAFHIPPKSQHRVLFLGVIGALILRAAFVLAGVELLQSFHAVLYVFGALLLLTGLKMFFPSKRALHPERNPLVRFARRIMPVTDSQDSERFFVNLGGKWNATPLFLALVAVEAMDIVFAVDSVPAVLAITRNTFIVYSSNAFAILGLRALYFALADLLPRFRFLHQGLAAILVFVGLKMILSERLPVSAPLSLGFIAGILAATVLASLLFPRSGAKSA
ncbi:MAG: TerC family protein [Candidatus Acidiferrales bacterium]